MPIFKGKTVAILGVSTEGFDSVKFFAARDTGRIICCDMRNEQELGSMYHELKQLPVEFQLGKTYLKNLDRADIIVRTPGMNPRLPELVVLKKQGKQITSLTKLFFDFCPAPIIGVTGTKGKGTTSTLIYEMLKTAGNVAYLGGNVGIPLLSKVDEIRPHDFVVLELSSFQLEDLKKSPHIAVVLRVTQEHLANYDTRATNFHPNRESYVEAKKSIVRFQTPDDFAIVSLDDPTSRLFAKETKAHAYFVSRSSDRADAYVKDHAAFIRWNNEVHKICSIGDTKLRGEHNLEDISYASFAAALCDVSLPTIRHVVRTFEGLPHRLQKVGELDEVIYIDDSFSTVPETAIAAIESFPEPIILILGGSEKGSDFTELGVAVAKSSVKCVIVIGDMTDRIVMALHKAGFARKIIHGSKTMHDVIVHARREAKAGDVVLLSPACASFDMFKNYKDRGEQFAYEIHHF